MFVQAGNSDIVFGLAQLTRLQANHIQCEPGKFIKPIISFTTGMLPWGTVHCGRLALCSLQWKVCCYSIIPSRSSTARTSSNAAAMLPLGKRI